jgi:hypothetical protein
MVYSSCNILCVRKKKKPSITTNVDNFTVRPNVRCGSIHFAYVHTTQQNTTTYIGGNVFNLININKRMHCRIQLLPFLILSNVRHYVIS